MDRKRPSSPRFGHIGRLTKSSGAVSGRSVIDLFRSGNRDTREISRALLRGLFGGDMLAESGVPHVVAGLDFGG